MEDFVIADANLAFLLEYISVTLTFDRKWQDGRVGYVSH